MWFERILGILREKGSPVIVEARDTYGFPFLADDLRRTSPNVIWMESSPELAGDTVLQGDLLSAACTRAFGARLFGTGLSFAYGLTILRRYADVLAPFTFVLGNAEYSLPLANALMAFALPEVGTVLHFQRLPSTFDMPKRSIFVGESDLRLTREEAASLLRRPISDSEYQELLVRTDGAFLPLQSELAARFGFTPRNQPSPTGESPDFQVPTVESDGLLHALLENEQWIDAYEVALRHAPHKVPGFIDRAGAAYFTEGQFGRFWESLKLLPDEVAAHETVAYWRFSAAIATNNHRKIQSEVRNYLTENEAAELRALVAISLPDSSMLQEAEQAYRSKENSITTRSLGFAYAVSGKPELAFDYLVRANEYARREGNSHLQVATANELAVAHQLAGNYSEAFRWASWALSQYNELGMKEELRRLAIISEMAFPAILIGRVQSVAPLLDSINIPADLYGIPSLEGLFSTLSEYAIVRGDTETALAYAEVNMKHLPDTLRGYGAIGMVQALLAANRFSEAIDLAESVYCSAYVSNEAEQLRCSLALGMALAHTDPEKARPHLARSLNGHLQLVNSPYLAISSIVLAGVELRLNGEDEAREVLFKGERALNEVSEVGWLLLGGNFDETRALWRLWNRDSSPVELRFLGGRKVRTGHAFRDFPLRWCEILAPLAYHSEGMTGEKLALMLYPDGGNMATIKSNVSRMRKEIPVRSRPYRIDLEYRADFVEMDKALREGRVREALELYQGPLLPESDAPFVVEFREHLEESLRQAALTSGDADVLLALARKLQDDLELWEAAEPLLSSNDPQLALVKAHIKRIQRAWA